MRQFLSYTIAGISSGFVYSLIALGFVLVYKCSRILNFAQGDVAILGAYLAYLFQVQLGLPIFLAAPLSLGVGAGLGLMMERLVVRKMSGQSELPMIIATMAIGGLLQAVMRLGWGTEWISLSMGFPKGVVRLGNMANVSYMHLFFMGVSFLVIAATSAFYRYTKMGLAMRACADDMVIAKSIGIKANRCVAASWLAACVIGVVAGILLTSITGINFTMTSVATKAIGVWIVGGLESLEGVLVVGPIMGAVEFLAAGYLDPLLGGSLGEVAPFLILLMVLFIRPFGVFGLKEIERV